MDVEANPTGCGMDPYVVDHDKSKCVDQQILKLQESPDDVPVGELPRHVLLSSDRELTNRVVPGSRATIMGIYSVFQSKPGVCALVELEMFKAGYDRNQCNQTDKIILQTPIERKQCYRH